MKNSIKFLVLTSALCLLAGCTRPSGEPLFTDESAPPAKPTNQILDGSLGGGMYKEYQTRNFFLKNGMEVLVISNPKLTQSSASLVVDVGQWHDPKEHIGLTHFLEHMLFQGSQKYPGVDEYKKYVSLYRGITNAYTSWDHTNYLVAVNNEGFNGTLDRFAQFFIAPLFKQESLDKERNNVNDEAMRNRTNDSWRSQLIMRKMFQPGHPGQDLNIGTNETLKNANQAAIRAHYDRFYSSDKMKLVVVSNQTLGQLEPLVRGIFEAVPKRKTTSVKFAPWYAKDQLPLRVQVRPFGDLKKMALHFTFPINSEDWKSKPLEVVAQLLGSKHKGGLSDRLKDMGLASKVDAGAGTRVNQQYLQLEINLTDEGVGRQDDILVELFSYIHFLQGEGAKSYAYDLLTQVKQFEYDYGNPPEVVQIAAKMSPLLRIYPGHEARARSLLIFEPSDLKVRRYLAQLQPENMVVTSFSSKAEVNQKEPMYNVEYSVAKLDKTLAQKLKATKDISYLYPSQNPYAPGQLSILPRLTPMPGQVLAEPGLEVWFHKDNLVLSPRGVIELRLRSPIGVQSAREVVVSKLWSRFLTESLSAWIGQIEEAGIKLEINTEIGNQLSISLKGISNHLVAVANELPERIQKASVSPKVFAMLKEELNQQYNNRDKDQAYKQAIDWHNSLTTPKSFNLSEQAVELAALSAADIEQFQKQFLGELSIKALVYGSVDENLAAQAIKKMPLVWKSKLTDSFNALSVAENVFTSGAPLALRRKSATNMNAWYSTVQLGARTPETVATASLLEALWSASYFSAMRTERKLGYVVTSRSTGFKPKISSYMFLIEGAGFSPNEFAHQTRTWVKEQVANVAKIPAAQFNGSKQAIINRLRASKNSMDERALQLSDQLFSIGGDFSFDLKVAAALEAMTQTDFNAKIQEAFAGDKVRQASAYLYSLERPIEALEVDQIVEDPAQVREKLLRAN